MFVVVVEFRLSDGAAGAFLPLMRIQARTSLDREPGCRRFDICTDAGSPRDVLLYEIYDDRAAFEAHLASPHVRAFDAAVAPLVDEKSVRLLQLEAT